VPLAGISSDPSFPSDHVSAAFAIAVAAMFFSRRAGRVLLVLACVTAASRLLRPALGTAASQLTIAVR
jgi:membrane-associated phospholipid phosphatase